MKIKFVKQDQWIGHYYDNNFHYVCLIPCVVLMWRKRVKKRVSIPFFEECFICKNDIPRGCCGNMDAKQGMMCRWCYGIRSNYCSHDKVVGLAPRNFRGRVQCAKCHAIQFKDSLDKQPNVRD